MNAAKLAWKMQYRAERRALSHSMKQVTREGRDLWTQGMHTLRGILAEISAQAEPPTFNSVFKTEEN